MTSERPKVNEGTIYREITEKATRVKFENYHQPVIHIFFAMGTVSYRVSYRTYHKAQLLVRSWEKISDTLHTETWMRKAI